LRDQQSNADERLRAIFLCGLEKPGTLHHKTPTFAFYSPCRCYSGSLTGVNIL
jgi:hypothetical protein